MYSKWWNFAAVDQTASAVRTKSHLPHSSIPTLVPTPPLRRPALIHTGTLLRGDWKFIILNTKFLVFDTQFLVFDTKFLVFDTKLLIFDTKLCLQGKDYNAVPAPEDISINDLRKIDLFLARWFTLIDSGAGTRHSRLPTVSAFFVTKSTFLVQKSICFDSHRELPRWALDRSILPYLTSCWIGLSCPTWPATG